MQDEKLDAEVRIRNLREQLNQAKQEMLSHEKQKTAVETSLTDLRVRCDRLEKDTQQKEQDIAELKTQYSGVQDNLRREQDCLGGVQKEAQVLKEKLTHAKSQHNELLRQISGTKEQNREKETQIQQFMQDQAQQRQVQNQINRQLQTTTQRIETLEIQKKNQEDKNDGLKTAVSDLEHQILQMRQTNNAVQKDADQLKREQQVVTKQLQVAEVTVADKQDLLQQQDS